MAVFALKKAALQACGARACSTREGPPGRCWQELPIAKHSAARPQKAPAAGRLSKGDHCGPPIRGSFFGAPICTPHLQTSRMVASASPTQGESAASAGFLQSTYGLLSTLQFGDAIAKLVANRMLATLVYNMELNRTQALFFTATGICYIPMATALYCLREAAAHNRLGSATYQRLNLSMNFFAVLFLRGLIMSQGKGVHTVQSLAALYIFAISLLVTSGIAYKGSTDSDDFLLWEIVKGYVAGIIDLFRPRTKLSGVYSFVSLGLFFQGAEAFLYSSLLKDPFMEFYLESSVAGGLWVASVAAYVLKDAADRARLDASTFKYLNAALAAMSASLFGIVIYAFNAGILMLESNSPLLGLCVRLGLLATTALTCTYTFLTAKK